MEFTRGIIVDGITFNLPLVSIKRKFDFLYKDGAGRTEDGVFHGELIGVYCNFTITVGKSSAFDGTDYEEFVEKMSEPNEEHTFSIPVKDGYYTFTGYLGSVSDEYEKYYQMIRFSRVLHVIWLLINQQGDQGDENIF